MEEDLDHLDGGSNAFLKALQTGKRNVRLWRRVQAECLTVCVPRLPLANRLKLTTELLERHILKPSPLYKGTYAETPPTWRPLRADNNKEPV
jgi:hypothetical protein